MGKKEGDFIMKKPMNKIMPFLMATAIAATSVPVSAAEKTVAAAAETSDYYAVNMKVSYNDFFQLYGVDTKKGVTSANYVDAVTSATMGKPAKNGKGELNQGSYYTTNEDNTLQYIEGVNIPVVVSAADKAALVAAGTYVDADFSPVKDNVITKTTTDTDGKVTTTTEAAIVQGSVVDASKVVSSAAVNAQGVKLSATTKASTTVTDATAKLNANTNWGDYEFDFSGDLFDTTLSMANNAIYGVIVNTKEGGQYAMYTQENIWRNFEVAWSVGGKTEAKGCPLRSEAYAASNGQTVTDFTFITSAGLYNVDIADTYLPVKTNASVKVADVTVDSKNILTPEFTNLPEDFVPAYSLAKAEGRKTTPVDAIVSTGAAVTVADLVPGSYKLTVADVKGKYADISASFFVKGSTVTFDGALKMDAKGKDSLANYIAEISSVDVTNAAGETTTYYTANQNKEFKKATLFRADGTWDTAAEYEAFTITGSGRDAKAVSVGKGKVFAPGTYTIAIKTTNYDVVTATVAVADAVVPTAPVTEAPATPEPTTPATTAPAEPTVTPSIAPTKKPVSKKAIKTLKLTSYKKNAKKIKGKTEKTATVKVKVGSKTYTVKAGKNGVFSVSLKKKLKKGNKIVVTVTKSGYKTLKKTFKVK